MRDMLKAASLILAGVFVLTGQPPITPSKWVGTWTLDVRRSSFGKALAPCVPETSEIRLTSQEIGFELDLSMSPGNRISHLDQRLRLDGSEAVLATGAILFVRRINDSSFDVIGKVTTGNTRIGEVSHFAFSPDGLTLTETKTQTEMEPDGRTSVSVLIFNKTG
jgi:hypothetical protein